MSTLEKALGAAAAVLAVLGAALTILGIAEAGVIAAVLVVFYGLFLLAQLLREARRQKRATELLRESVLLSRKATAEARLEGVHARNDIVGNTRRIRAELKDQSQRSDRRDTNVATAVASLGDRIGAEPETSITALILKEARGIRAVTRELAGNATSRLAQAEELLTAQMDARTRQVRRQAVTERTTIVAEMAKSEVRLNGSFAGIVEEVNAYQQLTAQKLIAQQDGLRRVVDLVRSVVADLESSVSAGAASLENVERSLGGAPGRDKLDSIETALASQQDDARALSRQMYGTERAIELLTDNARALAEQVLPMNQRVTEAGPMINRLQTPSMVELAQYPDGLRDSDGKSAAFGDFDIDVTIAAHKEALKRLQKTLQEVRRSEALSETERQRKLNTLYAQLGMQDVKQEFVLDVNSYDVGVSFRAQMVRLIHLKEKLSAKGYDISLRENDKLRDRAFAEALGIPTPALLFSDIPSSDVVLEPNSIIKPTVGESARGVFYVRPDLHLVSLKTRNVYATFAEAAAEYQRWSGESREPRWIGERAILDEDGNPARDVKVFMFYGEAGLFVEIIRGGSKILTATYDETGQRIIYRETDDPHRDERIPDGVVDLATSLSLASPVPFLRVDFLIGTDGPVLGEITPHPGGIYAGDAREDVDRRHGRMFLEADARLTIDLLNGKDFGVYLDAYGVGKLSHD